MENYFIIHGSFGSPFEIGLVGYKILYQQMENKYMYHNFQ